MESSEMNSNHKTAEWDFRKSILAPDHIKQETSEEDLENSEKNAHTQRGDRAQQCSNAAACEARLGSDQIKVEIVEWESFTIVQVGMDESAESLPGEPEGFAIELCKSEPEEPKPDVEGIEELESADVKQESCGLLHNGEEAEMHSDAFAPYSPQRMDATYKRPAEDIVEGQPAKVSRAQEMCKLDPECFNPMEDFQFEGLIVKEVVAPDEHQPSTSSTSSCETHIH